MMQALHSQMKQSELLAQTDVLAKYRERWLCLVRLSAIKTQVTQGFLRFCHLLMDLVHDGMHIILLSSQPTCSCPLQISRNVNSMTENTHGPDVSSSVCMSTHSSALPATASITGDPKVSSVCKELCNSGGEISQSRGHVICIHVCAQVQSMHC